MTSRVAHLVDSQFDASIAHGVALLDFCAPWCEVCRAQERILAEVAEAVGGRAAVATINADGSEVAHHLEIHGMPTLLVFRDGEEVRRLVGVQKGEDLQALLEWYVSHPEDGSPCRELRGAGRRVQRQGETAAGMSASSFDFGTIAERYDRWYETDEGALYDRLEKRAVARLLPHNGRGKELLDVGCGTGHWARFFSEHGFTIAGVDISPSMIRVARGKGIPRASFTTADAHELPFDSGRFDVAVAITALEFVRDQETVLREMVRCTRRPGGVVVVGVLNALARINRRRKAAGEPTYKEATFFSARSPTLSGDGFICHTEHSSSRG